MKVLAIWRVKDGADMSQVQSYLIEEERFAWRSYLDDVLREHYESDLPTPAISVLEVSSVDEARARFADLPLLREGFITAEYIPLRPFRNWEVLFREEEKVN